MPAATFECLCPLCPQEPAQLLSHLGVSADPSGEAAGLTLLRLPNDRLQLATATPRAHTPCPSIPSLAYGNLSCITECPGICSQARRKLRYPPCVTHQGM